MHRILTVIFAGAAFLAVTQTPLIAHKSHSGSSISYFIDPMSNFGAIKLDLNEPHRQSKPYKAENFRSLNDSTIILEVTDINQKVLKTDTLPNKKRYSPVQFKIIYTDSMTRQERQKLHEEELKREQEIIQQEKEQQKKLNLQQEHLNETPKKKEKKSYLLFLFGITGGGMLLLKIFSKSRISKTSIA